MTDWASIITRVMPGLVAVLYSITAAAFVAKREYAWGLVWFSYAMANVGLILAEAYR